MKTTTSLKIDNDVKEQAAKLASQMGLTLSTVINSSLRTFIAERRIVFSTQPEFNRKTEKKMDSILDDIHKGKNLKGPFKNMSDLRKYLLK